MRTYGYFERRGKHLFCRVHDTITGKYTWCTTHTSDRRLAEQWRRAKEEEEYHRLLHPEERHITLGAAVRAWLQELEQRVRPETMRGLRIHAEHWVSHWGEVELRLIGGAEIESYLSQLACQNSTRNQVRAVLKWFLHGWALRHGYVERDPTGEVSTYPVPERKIRTISDESLNLILAQPECAPIRSVVVLAAETGLRQGCLLSLCWEHIDFAAGWLRIPAELMKSNREFAAPLSTRALDTLRGLRDKVSGRIWGFSPDTLRRHWTSACKRAGLEYRFHDLRRTFLTKARQRGVPMEVAMVLSDHRDLRTVLRCYRAVDDGELLRAVGRDANGEEVRDVRSNNPHREGGKGRTS